jgi:predicted amidohydrolase
MKIAACQLPEVHGNIERALSLISSHTADAQRQGAKLVCFPECFLQGYDVSSGHVASVALELGSSAFERILRRLEALEPVIVFGVIEQRASKFYNDDRRSYGPTALINSAGTVVARVPLMTTGMVVAEFSPGAQA